MKHRDTLCLLTAAASLLAFGAHAYVVYQLFRLFGGGEPALTAVVTPAAPFALMLVVLSIAGILRARPMFPWGALATPWLLSEGIPSVTAGLQPSLAGSVKWATLTAGVSDLCIAFFIVMGCVVHWRR